MPIVASCGLPLARYVGPLSLSSGLDVHRGHCLGHNFVASYACAFSSGPDVHLDIVSVICLRYAWTCASWRLMGSLFAFSFGLDVHLDIVSVI